VDDVDLVDSVDWLLVLAVDKVDKVASVDELLLVLVDKVDSVDSVDTVDELLLVVLWVLSVEKLDADESVEPELLLELTRPHSSPHGRPQYTTTPHFSGPPYKPLYSSATAAFLLAS